MIVGLDTSVIVRVLTGEPEDLALVAVRYLRERQRAGDRVQVSDWVLAEAYSALQYHYEVPKSRTLEALRRFLSSSEIEGTGEAADVLETAGLASAKPGFIDRVIHCDYLRAGAEELATFEKAAAKLSNVRVLKVESERLEESGGRED